jgi:hypothetical protein
MSSHAPPVDAAGSLAFLLCELEWMRERLVLKLGDGPLSVFVEAVRDGRGGIDADDTQAIRVTADDAVQLLLAIDHGFRALPADIDVRVDTSTVAAAASSALEDGIANADRALHAARWIDVVEGLRTAARMLRNTDAYCLWDISVVRFLAAFNGADVTMAWALASEAEVAHLRCTRLSRARARGLAKVLERTLGEPA